MNLGIDAALARGVHAILLLTHECRLDPGALLALVARLDQAPGVGAVGPLLGFASEPDLVFSAGAEVEPKWGTRHRRQPKLIHEWSGSAPHRVQCLDGAALLLRASALRAAGRMDEKYFMYFEETEYLLRLQRLGWAVECVPAALAWQEPGPKSSYLWERNRLRFLARNCPRSVLVRQMARLARDIVRDWIRPGSDRAHSRAQARALLHLLGGRWAPDPAATTDHDPPNVGGASPTGGRCLRLRPKSRSSS